MMTSATAVELGYVIITIGAVLFVEGIKYLLHKIL